MDKRLKKNRLDAIIGALLSLSKGDYSAQIELSEENDELDAISIGINMMIESIKMKFDEAKILNEELLRVNAAKDKIFSIVGHDLKSPFNSILGFSEILNNNALEKDYHAIEKHSLIILESAQRAVELLTNLFEWTLLQTGKIEYNPDYFEMGDLINEIVLLLSNDSLQKSINITKSLLPNAVVQADRNMISTVLRNLISNAIKFTHPKGEIIVSTEIKQGKFLVSVNDNGVGIKKDSIEKIFQVDQCQSTRGTQNEKGTGLGVILCKEFVEKHGGRLWVESEVDKGSTFYFTIPYNIDIPNTD